ncbi:MAG: alpha/beta hydrolase family protein [Lysobacterales bacterium]
MSQQETNPSRVPVTRNYGPLPDQVGDILVPDGHSPHPVVVVIHGGFWRERFKRDRIAPLAEDLTSRGWATWNIEYRRVGESGGGFPETFEDVANAIDYLNDLSEEYELDLARTVLLGYSAGGHLAVWAGNRHVLRRGAPGAEPAVEPMAVVSLAGVMDLEEAHRLGTGNNATEPFIHETVPSRYQLTSPTAMLPAKRLSILVHGENDANVPHDQSLRYVEKARETGDLTPLLAVIPGADHPAMVDPAGEAWKRVAAGLDWLLSVSKGNSLPLPNGFRGPQGHEVELLIDSARHTLSD